MKISRKQRKRIARQNEKRPKKLQEIPHSYLLDDGDISRIRTWVSRYFLVQEFIDVCGIRMTVNRTNILPCGKWEDKITWDELQDIKRHIGYGNRYAVEIYPRDCDIVNNANMRHLWILKEPLDIGWRNK